MTDNEKLARWQGWEHLPALAEGNTRRWKAPSGRYYDQCPDYAFDVAAMSLLDTLVEKGYDITLMTTRLHPTLWMCMFFNSSIMIDRQKPTRKAAVCAACLELIERETLSGKEDV